MQTDKDVILLNQLETLQTEINNLSVLIQKEKQLNERVLLNIDSQNRRKAIQDIKTKLITV